MLHHQEAGRILHLIGWCVSRLGHAQRACRGCVCFAEMSVLKPLVAGVCCIETLNSRACLACDGGHLL